MTEFEVVPVDYDPFAKGSYEIVPVDYDPFEEKTVAGEFVKGAKAGWLSANKAVGSVLEYAGKLSGIESVEEVGKTASDYWGNAMKGTEAAVQNMTDIGKGGEFWGDLSKWAAWNVGQMGAQMATTAPFMAMGGGEMKGAISGIDAVKGIIARSPGAAGRFGRFLGQWAKLKPMDIPIGILEAGQIAEGQLEDLKKGKTKELSPIRGLAAAFVATKLEELGAENALNRLMHGAGMKNGRLLARIGKGALNTGIGEGTEEFFQQYAEQVGIDPSDAASKEQFMQAVNAAGAGFIGGFFLGGGGGAISREATGEEGNEPPPNTEAGAPTGPLPGVPPPGQATGAPASTAEPADVPENIAQPAPPAPQPTTPAIPGRNYEALPPEFIQGVQDAIDTGKDPEGNPFSLADATNVLETYRRQANADPNSIKAMEDLIQSRTPKAPDQVEADEALSGFQADLAAGAFQSDDEVIAERKRLIAEHPTMADDFNKAFIEWQGSKLENVNGQIPPANVPGEGDAIARLQKEAKNNVLLGNVDDKTRVSLGNEISASIETLINSGVPEETVFNALYSDNPIKGIRDLISQQEGGQANGQVQTETKVAGESSYSQWAKEREDRIKASKKAGVKHLDDYPAYVETLRGKEIYNVHDPKERGTILTVSNNKDVVVRWADKYSEEKNSTGLQDIRKDGKVIGKGSWLLPSDGKDYIVVTGKQQAAPSPAPAAPPLNEPAPQTTDVSPEGEIGQPGGDLVDVTEEYAKPGEPTKTPYEYGKAAFAAGLKAVPMQDPEFMREAKKSGTSAKDLEEWTRGWHEANAAAPVSGVTGEREKSEPKKPAKAPKNILTTGPPPGGWTEADKVPPKKQPWEMTRDEWLRGVRFYRSGKTKNAQVPGGERVILSQDSTATNFREKSKDFLHMVRSQAIAGAIQRGDVVPPEVLADFPELDKKTGMHRDVVEAKAETEKKKPLVDQRDIDKVKALTKKLVDLGATVTGYEEWVKAMESGDPAQLKEWPDVESTIISIEKSIEKQERINAASGKPSEEPVKEEKPPAFGSANKLFTEDKAAKAREILKAKLGGIHMGVPLDPEIIQAGIDLAGYYIEGGARSFDAYSRKMIADLGDAIRPYLKSFYAAVRNYPGFDKTGMNTEAETDQIDENSIDITEKSTKLESKEGGVEDERPANGSLGQRPLEENEPPRVPQDGERQGAAGGERGGSKTDAEGDGRPYAGEDDGTGSVGSEPVPIHLPDAGEAVGELQPVGDQSTPASEPRGLTLAGDNPGNYRITPEDDIGSGTRGQKIDRNIAAIRLVKKLEKENRYPTKEEQAVLAKYVGWGGLKNVFKETSPSPQDTRARQELEKLLSREEMLSAFLSITDAHYTSPEIITSIYDILRHMGFEGGNVLEPTYGAGNFLGLMPEDMSASSKWYGSELDTITAKIGQYLYPESQLIESGFQSAEFPFGKFDLAIGNPPFGDTRISDPKKSRAEINRFKIHNYVIAKEAMHLRPGGVLANVITTRFLDTADSEARDFLAKQFRFLGAIRLPNDAFSKNAGTTVTTDIIFLQRLMPGEKPDMGADWLTTGAEMVNSEGETITLNRYFAQNPDMMLGEPSMKGTMYGGAWKHGGKGEFTLNKREGQDIAKAIKDLLGDQLSHLRGVFSERANDKADAAALSLTINREDVGIGGYYSDGSKVFMRKDDDEYGNPTFEELTPATIWSSTLIPDGRGGYTREATQAGKKVTIQYRTAAEVPDTLRLGETRLSRIKGMLDLRQKAYRLIEAERFDIPGIEKLRKELNKAYDNFVKKNGFLSDPANVSLMADDIKIEFGLESNYKKEITKTKAKTLGIAPMKATAQKAAILTKRVFYPEKEITSAASVSDGYNISLSQKGRLDVKYIAKLTKKSVDDVTTELSEKGLAYKDPETDEWIPEDEYLSGNVKEKYQKAMAAGAEKNAAALKEVFPADKQSDQIYAGMGATWIPKQVYVTFGEFIGISYPSVMISQDTGRILMSGRDTQNDVNVAWKNEDYGMADIFNAAAGNKSLVAYDGTGDDRTVNKDRTRDLKRIGESMKETFNDWLMSDEARAKVVTKEFNDTQNTHAKRKFNGKLLSPVGSSPAVSLRNTQRNAAWRMIQSAATLLDHVVGSGKTFTIITGVMERVRMGLTRKAMIVVPNHLVGQWAADWLKLYPGANILAATNKDFSAPNRRRLFSRITTGKYDAVIVGHSSFGFIPMEHGSVRALIMEEIAHLERAMAEAKRAGEKRTVSNLAKRIQKKKERIAELMKKPRDNVSHFEQMGIDFLVVDESHEFKNLEYSTAMQNVAGMGNQSGSKRAFDLYSKIRYLSAQKGTGVTFATGTPISNSLVEMYSSLRYLNRKGLVDRKIEAFDAWASAYASTEQRIEYTASQRLKERTIMATFKNVHQLIQLYDEFADTVLMDDLKKSYREQIRESNKETGAHEREEFPVPKIKDGGRQLDLGEPDDAQRKYVDYLVARSARLEEQGRATPADAKIDNPLWIMSDARKMALDIRLVDPRAKEGANNKITRAADKIKAIYDQWNADKGTQLVFCDLSTPLKTAEKGAKAFIKAASKIANVEKDRAVQDRLSRMISYQDRWAYLRRLIENEIDAITESKDAETDAYMRRREALETFLAEKAGDADLAALTTADTGFSVYDDLKGKLVERGIPAGEVRFIHEANTAAQKDELFGLVNSGAVRVLIGSTPKMGAGTNAQERAVALHHLDAPWKPSDMEQREGRVIRQGNALYDRDPDGFEVALHAYSTSNTLDSVMWQILDRKQGMLDDFRSGRDVIQDQSSDSASYAEFMAETTGNQAFKEKYSLENEIQTLLAAKRRIQTRINSASYGIKSNAKSRERARKTIEDMTALKNAFAGTTDKTFSYNGQTFENDIHDRETEERARLKEINDAEAERHAGIRNSVLADLAREFPNELNPDGTSKEELDAAQRKRISKVYDDKLEEAGIKQWPKRVEFDREKIAKQNPDGATAALLKVRQELKDLPKGNGKVAYTIGGLDAEIVAEDTASYSKKDEGKKDFSFYIDGKLVGFSEAKASLYFDDLEPFFDREAILRMIDRRLDSERNNIAYYDEQDKTSEQTLAKLEFKDEEKLREKQARYEVVVREVNEIEDQMDERRSRERNEYIDRDKKRFPNGYTPRPRPKAQQVEEQTPEQIEEAKLAAVRERRMTEARYSLSASEAGWSLSDVQDIFKGQEVIQPGGENSPIYIKTRGGKYLTIESVTHINPNEIDFQMSHGVKFDRKTMTIAGAYGQGNVRLVRGVAGRWTLAHETAGHFFEDAGLISSADVAVLRGHIKRMVREGKIETANKEDIGGSEDRANFIADELTKPKAKGIVGRIIARVRDFLDRLVNAFGKRTAGGVVRDIKSGKVFEGKAEAGGRVGEQYSAVRKTGEASRKVKTGLEALSDSDLSSMGKPDDAVALNMLLKEAILRLPNGTYLLNTTGRAAPSLRKSISDMLGFEVSAQALEKNVRGLAAEHPEAVEASLTLGLEEVRLSNHVEPPEGGGRIQYSVKKITENKEGYKPGKEADPPGKDASPAKVKEWVADATDAGVHTLLAKRPSLLPHMTMVEKVLKSPEWYDHPILSQIVRLFMRDREELYHQYMNHFNDLGQPGMEESTVTELAQNLKGKGLSLRQRLAGRSSKEYQDLMRYIDQGDVEIIKPEDMLKLMKKEGASEDTIAVWRAMRESYDKALELMTAQMREMKEAIEEEAAFKGISPPDYSPMWKTLKGAIAQMETWKGSYAPRIRQGNWSVTMERGEGEDKEYYRENRYSEFAARRLANKMKREGWTVRSISEIQRLPEDVYADLKTVSVAKAIEQALEGMSKGASFGPARGEQLLKFNEELLAEVADLIRQRGFRSSMIHRSRNAGVVRGYIEDPIERHLVYINNLSRGFAKAKVAGAAANLMLGKTIAGRKFGGIDPAKEPRVYTTAKDYIEEQLRNLDTMDRVIGFAKGIATLKFLGGSARSALVNTSAMVTTAPPAIQQYAGNGKVGFMKVNRALARAGAEIPRFMAGREIGNADEQRFLHEAQRLGWDDAQYTRDMMAKTAKLHSKAWNVTMNAAMFMFGKTEQWNRLTTMLAAYRIARGTGKSHEEASELAKVASDRAHGIYGRATLPQFAWGRNWIGKAGQAVYVYSKFSHNYLQMMYDLGMKKGNVKAMMYGLIAPIVIGGAASLPFKDQIWMPIIGALMTAFGLKDKDEDPEKVIWEWVKKKLGEGGEIAGRYGLFGAFGLDISGSLAIGVGLPKDWWEAAGALGGAAKEGAMAFQQAKKGNYGRAAEHLMPAGAANVAKAFRERREGVTTEAGRPVWDTAGKPFRPTTAESLLRAAGFRSPRQAATTERLYEGKQQAANYAERRQAIYDRYRLYITRPDKEEFKKIRDMVRQYNAAIKEAEVNKEVPRIVFSEMRTRINREMRRAGKREREMLR